MVNWKNKFLTDSLKESKVIHKYKNMTETKVVFTCENCKNYLFDDAEDLPPACKKDKKIQWYQEKLMWGVDACKFFISNCENWRNKTVVFKYRSNGKYRT